MGHVELYCTATLSFADASPCTVFDDDGMVAYVELQAGFHMRLCPLHSDGSTLPFWNPAQTAKSTEENPEIVPRYSVGEFIHINLEHPVLELVYVLDDIEFWLK